MISVRVESRKDFFRHLFLQGSFDNFLVTDLTLRTDIRLEMDGRLLPGSDDTAGDPAETAKEPARSWGSLRPKVSAFLAGEAPLRSLKLILTLSRRKTEEFLEAQRLELAPGDVEGFFVNVLYTGDALTLTTGCSLKQFSLDRSPEKAWDRQITRLLEQLELKTGEA